MRRQKKLDIVMKSILSYETEHDSPCKYLTKEVLLPRISSIIIPDLDEILSELKLSDLITLKQDGQYSLYYEPTESGRRYFYAKRERRKAKLNAYLFEILKIVTSSLIGYLFALFQNDIL